MHRRKYIYDAYTAIVIRRQKTPTLNDYESRANTVLLLTKDSDLEAFSHYPTDDSFATLPCQAIA